ncbi:MAG TPA: HAMP domain-containing sensor histidine kinase, partial [Chloroflexota bacterium]|nr:HAMP domain-containing sensor histidine kinase [Chloroflexota bacterium]
TQGQVTAQITFGLTASQQALQPKLPNPLPTPRGGSPAFLTAPSQDGQDSYRVAVGLSDQGQEVVIAIPRTDIESTLNRLLLVEAGVGAGVLLVLGAVGAYAVRLGLRPLDRIGATAGRIAAGDLQQRVTPATPKTEVGRLGLALNAMLEKIEEAFAARRASEERLRRFVSDASHELRTPVASIRGYAELFRRGAKANPEDLAMSMRRIEDEAARMGHLVDDLLLLARLDERRPMEREAVDLSQLASDAAMDARAMDPTRTISTSLADDAIVAGDELRLRQVVANLARNALVHTPAGTPLEIATTLVPPSSRAAADKGAQTVAEAAGTRRLDRDMVELRVADHGPGIPPQVAAKIFERFFRADPARGRAQGSSGLGLSIVAAIVEAHGGSIEVQPTPGGGATFVVRLPLYATAEPAEKPAAPSLISR